MVRHSSLRVARKNKAIFIDRDGTVSKLPTKSGSDRLYRTEDFEEIPGSFQAIKELNEAGFLIIVITNQAGIAKGIYCEEDHFKITRHIEREAKKAGAKIDDTYFCPFHKDAKIKRYYHPDHPDRKPNPGMLKKAIKKFNIDPKKSFMVGDHITDMNAGENAGVKDILVLTGLGNKFKDQLKNLKQKPVFIAHNLKKAADWIAKNESK